MPEKSLLIVYHSEQQHTMFMALNIGHGAESAGVKVDIVEVERCSVDSLSGYDGLVIGSPTFFSNMSWPVKKLIDESVSLRGKGFLLRGKVGGGFTSTAKREDGVDCLRMIELALELHHRMELVPGVVVTNADSENSIAERCQEYGERLANRILGKNGQPS